MRSKYPMHFYTQKDWTNPLAPSNTTSVFRFETWNLVSKILKLHYNQKAAS